MYRVTEIYLSRDEVEKWNALPESIVGDDLHKFIELIEFELAHANWVDVYSEADYVQAPEIRYMPVHVITAKQLDRWYELEEDVIGWHLFEFIGDIATQLDMGGHVRICSDDNYFTES